MPFAATFDDIYQFGIQGAANDVGAYAERLDKQLFAENILERMYNQALQEHPAVNLRLAPSEAFSNS